MRPSSIAIGTFLLVVIVAAAFFTLRISEGPSPASNGTSAAAPQITLLKLDDNYRKGTHTISGTLMLPTACTPFTATTTPSTSAGGIRIDIASQEDDKVCLELPATTTFSVTASGESSSTVTVYLNGALATTTTAS